MSKEIYNKIYERVRTFMYSDNQFLILKTYTGSGKTTNTLRALFDDHRTWIYLAPFHHVIVDNLELSTMRNYNYIHLQSRRILCEIEAYRKIAERGINIRPICENSCPLRETTCPYYERKRRLYEQPQNWAGVHHHITSYLPEFFELWSNNHPMDRYYDVLIIDENPISVFFDNAIIVPKSLQNLINFINRLNFENQYKSQVKTFLNYLIDNFGNRLNYEELYDVFIPIDFEDFYDAYQEEVIEAIRRQDIRVEDIPTGKIEMFSEMRDTVTEEKLPYMIQKRRAYNKPYFAYFLANFKPSPLSESPLPIIGLDGTANIDIWEAITNREASVLNKRYIYKNMFMLDTNARYPRSTWLYYDKLTDIGKRLCKIIEKICNNKNSNVLVASTLALKKYIKKNVDADNIEFCHFYYLRSRNDLYEKADTLVVACEPNIPPNDLESFEHLSNWDRDIWWQVFTHEEIKQAVGRIREYIDSVYGRKREEREIFVFPNTKNPDGRDLFPEARKLSYTEMDLYLDKGWLPISPEEKKQEIYELIPENDYITKKQLAKKLDLTRSDFRGLIRQLMLDGKIDDKGQKGITRY